MRRTLGYTIVLLFMATFFVNNISFSQNSTITGTVKYGNETLQAATISLAGQTKLTNDKGEFSFSVKPGTYTIIITHAGYKKMEQTIIAGAGTTKNLEFKMIPDDQLEEITIMGSRTGTERSNLNTAVPIDVLSSSRLMQTGQPSFIQMLNYSLPSFNAERQKSSEPVTYRGLDPDHLLILLNNTRYHNSAWLNNGTPKSNLGRGSTSNDLGSIPFVAVDKVEVLRDGASAQYGSDAIAAVLNIRLKESTGKTFIQANIGKYYAGDGLKSWIGLYRGFKLNKKGFISFSTEVRTQAPTTRANEYDGLVYEVYRSGMSAADSARVRAKDDSTILANGINRSDFIKNGGTSKLKSFGLLVNGGYPLNDRLKLFWTATINYKKNYFWGNYRFPKDPTQVNKFLYPNGFKPIITSSNWDATAIAGIKGILRKNWYWELSSSFGNNTNRLDVYNTNNASQQDMLGADAPTSFYLGTLVYSLVTNNISFTKDLAKKK